MSSVDVRHGDCSDVIRTLADCSIDSVVTDPPYALVSITKRFGKTSHADETKTSDRTRRGADGYARLAKGFMGKEWDNGAVAFDPEFWIEVLRVLKPGGHIVAFGGTRTYHRLACAIEDAGFEIRDQIGWLYGSGFPKSHNAGEGRGTALKPAWEPIVLARKLLIGTVAGNVSVYGTGAINIDACRVATNDSLGGGGEKEETSAKFGNDGWRRPWMENKDHRERQASKVRANVQKAEQLGRWPANIIHDGSDEVVAAFPESDGQQGDVRGDEPSSLTNNVYGKFHGRPQTAARNDGGSAARFFYSAKADAGDRLGSKHPTVKPVDLMAYLCRLITPPGGTVLDPFAGSGTTGMACLRESFNAILIEREAEYVADIRARLAHVHGDDTPLFSLVGK